MKRYIPLLTISLLAFGPAFAPGQPTTPKQPKPVLQAKKYERFLYPIQHRDPQQIADALTKFLGKDMDIQIQLAPQSNLLMIRVEQRGLKETMTLLQQLDQPPKLVHVEVWIAELKSPGDKDGKHELSEADWSGPMEKIQARVQAWKKEKKIVNLDHIELKTLEHQKASAVRGSMKAVVTGVIRGIGGFGGRGGPAKGGITTTRQIQYKNDGTTLELTPRATAGQILIELKLDDTRNIIPDNAVQLATDDAGIPIYATETVVSKVDTNVRVPSGHAVLARGVESRSKSGQVRQLLIVVAAKVVEPKR